LRSADVRNARSRFDEAGSLAAVGITAQEQRAYEVLLASDGATLSELAHLLTESPRKVRRLLLALELKGLARHAPERVTHYFAAPPDMAIEALVLARQQELQRTRLLAARLQEHAQKAKAKSATHPDERVIEIVTGRHAQAQVFEQMQRSARTEILSIERPPYVLDMSEMNEAQHVVMARGVVCRNVIDSSAFEIPGNLARIRYHIEAGERTRTFRGVPLKLVVADRRMAIIPLQTQRAGDPALVVRSSSLLDALCELFEMIWERAAPISLDDSAMSMQDNHASPNLPADFAGFVPLLAAGLNDKTIAHELGISPRTFDRRIRAFMKGLEARTRFQAGWLAAHRAGSMPGRLVGKSS
jgi:sugar-specific transcriptional regulator TrmB